jgi:hypothetical protein
MAIVTVLPELHLQHALFLSQLMEFFFGCYEATVFALPIFDKPYRTPEQL